MMFTDARSKRLILVAHCILNQNSISDGTSAELSARSFGRCSSNHLHGFEVLGVVGIDRSPRCGGAAPDAVLAAPQPPKDKPFRCRNTRELCYAVGHRPSP